MSSEDKTLWYTYHGMFNSLAQTLVKMLAPGVPHFYQGSEIWDLSFVGLDNRRPVDFSQRAEVLKNLRQEENDNLPALLKKLLAQWEDGWIKLYLIRNALTFRNQWRELFLDGSYIPLRASGPGQPPCLCFCPLQAGAVVHRRSAAPDPAAAPGPLTDRVGRVDNDFSDPPGRSARKLGQLFDRRASRYNSYWKEKLPAFGRSFPALSCGIAGAERAQRGRFVVLAHLFNRQFDFPANARAERALRLCFHLSANRRLVMTPAT